MPEHDKFEYSKEEVKSQNHDVSSVDTEKIDKTSNDVGIRNFKYFDDLIHSGEQEIILDSDIVFSDGEDSEYSDGINLDVDDLIIDGNGFTVDARAKARIFWCSGENITIKNINLKNGFSKFSGGAIYNSGGTINIENAIIDSNSCENDGGAIYNTQKKVIASQTTRFEVVTIHIKDSKLINNKARRNGGAIYNGGCDITFDPSNVDRYDMYSAERYNEIKLDNCEMRNNTPDNMKTDKKYTRV